MDFTRDGRKTHHCGASTRSKRRQYGLCGATLLWSYWGSKAFYQLLELAVILLREQKGASGLAICAAMRQTADSPMPMPMSTSRSLASFGRSSVAALLLLAGTMILAGCSSVVDHVPSAVGGLPEGAPQRPAAPPAYPAVHEMPPARPTTVLTDEEQTKLEADLAKARSRASGQAEQGGSTGKSTGSARNP